MKRWAVSEAPGSSNGRSRPPAEINRSIPDSASLTHSINAIRRWSIDSKFMGKLAVDDIVTMSAMLLHVLRGQNIIGHFPRAIRYRAINLAVHRHKPCLAVDRGGRQSRGKFAIGVNPHTHLG